MTAGEAGRFERSEHFDSDVRLRRRDGRAKDPSANTRRSSITGTSEMSGVYGSKVVLISLL
jgi:hypothetical protein